MDARVVIGASEIMVPGNGGDKRLLLMVPSIILR